MDLHLTLALVALLMVIAGILLARWAARRRPPNWRRMTWSQVARTPGTHEGVLLLGLALLLLGAVALALVRVVRF